MQHCSPLWSASSFTLRCPFYSLFPRATLPHRPLLPVSLDTHTWTHTNKHALWAPCIHFLLSDFNLYSSHQTSVFIPSPLWNNYIHQKGPRFNTVTNVTHSHSLSNWSERVITHKHTQKFTRGVPTNPLCTCSSARARSSTIAGPVTVGDRMSRHPGGKRSALPPEVTDWRHERLRQSRHGSMTHLQDTRYIWRAREGERKWQRKRGGGMLLG